MKSDGSAEWFDLMHEYFGVYMPVGRPAMWLIELRQSTSEGGTGPGTTDDEICRAIRFYKKKTANAAQDGGERRKKEATLDDLIKWIRWMRKDARQSANGPDGDGDTCAACYHGWVTVWPDLPSNPEPEDYTPRSGETTAPCMCTAGRRIMTTAKEYIGITDKAREGIDALARLGVSQAVGFRQRYAGKAVA